MPLYNVDTFSQSDRLCFKTRGCKKLPWCVEAWNNALRPAAFDDNVVQIGHAGYPNGVVHHRRYVLVCDHMFAGAPRYYVALSASGAGYAAREGREPFCFCSAVWVYEHQKRTAVLERTVGYYCGCLIGAQFVQEPSPLLVCVAVKEGVSYLSALFLRSRWGRPQGLHIGLP